MSKLEFRQAITGDFVCQPYFISLTIIGTWRVDYCGNTIAVCPTKEEAMEFAQKHRDER